MLIPEVAKKTVDSATLRVNTEQGSALWPGRMSELGSGSWAGPGQIDSMEDWTSKFHPDTCASCIVKCNLQVVAGESPGSILCTQVSLLAMLA